MYLNVHCHAISMSDLDSLDSVDAKNGLTHLDWTPDPRDTECVLKWVIVRGYNSKARWLSGTRPGGSIIGVWD